MDKSNNIDTQPGKTDAHAPGISPKQRKCVFEDTLYEGRPFLAASEPYVFYSYDKGVLAHWQENIEILYFYSTGTVICDRIEYTVEQGDVVVIPSNALHAVQYNESTYYDCLIVDRDFLSMSGVDVSALDFERVIKDTQASELYSKVRCTISQHQRRQPFSEAAVKAVILLLCTYLCQQYSFPHSDEQQPGGIVKRAIGYIKANYNKELSVGDIASHVGISKYYFCREFRSITGMSVVQYINNLRCEKAKKMILDGKYSIRAVAHLCGFDNMSYFSRTYKSFVGVNPSETRVLAKSNSNQHNDPTDDTVS